MSWGRYENRGKRIRCLFWIAVGLFAIHASSYLLMPVATEFAESRNSNTPLLAIGCIFSSDCVSKHGKEKLYQEAVEWGPFYAVPHWSGYLLFKSSCCHC